MISNAENSISIFHSIHSLSYLRLISLFTQIQCELIRLIRLSSQDEEVNATNFFGIERKNQFIYAQFLQHMI